MMNKLILICFSCIFIFLNGCKKDLDSTNSIDSLKSELNLMAHSSVNEQNAPDPCNKENKYDTWGESSYVSVLKVSQTNYEKGVKTDPVEIKNLILSQIPKEYLTLDTTGVNLKKINLLSQEFLSLFINRSIFESVYLSKQMEDLVSASKSLSEVDKAYLLKFVSLLRYYSYLSSMYIVSSKGVALADRTFEQCWIDSLQAIEDGGIIARLACVVDWPACFAIIIADCTLEQVGIQ
jgi:hypothetical protein